MHPDQRFYALSPKNNRCGREFTMLTDCSTPEESVRNVWPKNCNPCRGMTPPFLACDLLSSPHSAVYFPTRPPPAETLPWSPWRSPPNPPAGDVMLFFLHTSTFQLLDKPWSQVSSLFPPGSCLQPVIANRVQQSHCSSIFHRVLPTHALAFSASQFVHKKKPRNYTSMHSRGFELTKLTYTRLEDNLIRHRGDR